MPKTKKITVTRATSKKTPRSPAMKLLRAGTVDLTSKVSPTVRKKVRQNLPIAAAIAAGGAAVATGVVMRDQLADAARAVGSAGASTSKWVAKAITLDHLLAAAGLGRRKPFWQRTLPLLGITGGVLVAGAAAYLFIPRGRAIARIAHDAVPEPSMSSQDDFGMKNEPFGATIAERQVAHEHS
jgi:hypothetical protein